MLLFFVRASPRQGQGHGNGERNPNDITVLRLLELMQRMRAAQEGAESNHLLTNLVRVEHWRIQFNLGHVSHMQSEIRVAIDLLRFYGEGGIIGSIMNVTYHLLKPQIHMHPHTSDNPSEGKSLFEPFMKNIGDEGIGIWDSNPDEKKRFDDALIQTLQGFIRSAAEAIEKKLREHKTSSPPSSEISGGESGREVTYPYMYT